MIYKKVSYVQSVSLGRTFTTDWWNVYNVGTGRDLIKAFYQSTRCLGLSEQEIKRRSEDFPDTLDVHTGTNELPAQFWTVGTPGTLRCFEFAYGGKLVAMHIRCLSLAVHHPVVTNHVHLSNHPSYTTWREGDWDIFAKRRDSRIWDTWAVNVETDVHIRQPIRSVGIGLPRAISYLMEKI